MSFLTDQKQMGHLFCAWLTFSGYLPENRPVIFSTREWKVLTTLSTEKKLLTPYMTSPLMVRFQERLALYYYVLSRYGNDVASLCTFSQKLQLKHIRWWSKSQIFAPAAVTNTLGNVPIHDAVFQKFTIDDPIASHRFFADKHPAFLMSAAKAFLEKYIFVAFERSDLDTIWRAGTKGRSFKLLQPISEIWKRGVELFPIELERACMMTFEHPNDLAYMIKPTSLYAEAPKPTPPLLLENVHLKHQFNNITNAARFFALYSFFSKALPPTKPSGVSEENWIACKSYTHEHIFIESVPNGRVSYRAPLLFDLLTTTVHRRQSRFYTFNPPYFPERHWWSELTVISPVRIHHIKAAAYVEREFPVHSKVSMHPYFQQLNSQAKGIVLVILFRETLRLAYGDQQLAFWEHDRMKHATNTHPKQVCSLMGAHEATAQKIGEFLTAEQIKQSQMS
jgi:hypothetical protein